MAKFYGDVGFGDTKETSPGVWKKIITQRPYYGDVIRNARSLQDNEKVNKDVTVSNSISIVADAYAYENFYAMQYVSWSGALWVVTEVVVERPRLVLRLGGLYNGPTPDPIE